MATENSTPAAAPAEPAAVHQDAGAASDTAAPAPPTDALPVKPSDTTDPAAEQRPQQPTQETGSDSQAQTSEPSPKPPTSTSSDAHATKSTKQTSPEVDTSKPKDFDGEIATTSELPAPELIKKLDQYVVLDRHGKTHTFKSLHSGRNVARRMLVIFVRHFYCGNCQDYLRTLSESITTDALLGLPVNTFITVIGCGDPALIQEYADITGCPFPIYTDPTRSLFKALGMTRTWDKGEKPAYMRRSLFATSVSGVVQGLKNVTTGLATKSGDFKQVGGEFLFEPSDLITPISTPEAAEVGLSLDQAIAKQEAKRTSGSTHEEEEDVYGPEEKRVTWCHRMRTTRDHAEIPELMEVLGLDGNGKPIDDQKRWSKALQNRKGTGLSMASDMSKMSRHSQQVQQKLELPA